MPQVANTLGLLLAGIFFLSAATKVTRGFGREAASRTALGKMLAERPFLIAWRTLTATEIGFGALVVWLPRSTAGTASAVFFVGAALFAAVALRVTPNASCGCLGLT